MSACLATDNFIQVQLDQMIDPGHRHRGNEMPPLVFCPLNRTCRIDRGKRESTAQ